MSGLIALFVALIQAVAATGSPTGSPTGSIEGMVVRAGTHPLLPLINARLELTGGSQSLVVRTDGTGRFTFSNLQPGNYRLSVVRDGYLRQQFGQRRSDAADTPIRMSAGQRIRDVVFSLEPAPTISGLIRDADGSPLADILVQALRPTYGLLGDRQLGIFASTRTDDRGEYRLYWLDPGEYLVQAIQPPLPMSPGAAKVSYAPTYFPGFPDADNGRVLRLETGREAGGVDFRMVRQPITWISGLTFNALTKAPVSARIHLTPFRIGSARSLYEALSNEQGMFSIQGVVPGAYVVSAVSGSGESLAAFSRIQVRDFDPRITLELGPGVPVTGRIFDPPASIPARDLQVQLIPVDGFLPVVQALVRPDRNFLVPGVQPGNYVMNVSGLEQDQYVSAARFGAADPLEKPITIRYGDAEPPGIQILVASDGGRLDGVVYDGTDAPFSGAQLTLIPAEGSTHRMDRYRLGSSDEAGRFYIRGVPPGDYNLYAWEAIESRAWFNTDYMRRYEDLSVAVKVTAGETTSSISIRLIQADP